MIRERLFPGDWRAQLRGTSRQAVLRRLCRFLLVSAVLTGSFGCAFHTGLLAEEREAIRTGKAALVLLRVICSIDGKPSECFGKVTSISDGPVVAFGLGSFETGGEPRPTRYGFLSETSRAAGWAYFLLAPGVYYLAVMGPTSSIAGDFREMPRWRIDVPDYSSLVYVGTLQLSGRDAGNLMFGAKIIKPSTGVTAPSLADETVLARDVLSGHFGNAAEMKTNLLARWRPGDPIIIRSPKRIPTN